MVAWIVGIGLLIAGAVLLISALRRQSTKARAITVLIGVLILLLGLLVMPQSATPLQVP